MPVKKPFDVISSVLLFLAVTLLTVGIKQAGESGWTLPSMLLLVGGGLVLGAVLARAHAHTGDAAQIACYLGKSTRFDQALVQFAVRYADQNERDWEVFRLAIQLGLIQ